MAHMEKNAYAESGHGGKHRGGNLHISLIILAEEYSKLVFHVHGTAKLSFFRGIIFA